MYCNHCQPCPAHIDIAAVTKFLDLASSQPEVPETVMQHYWSLNATIFTSRWVHSNATNMKARIGVKVRENMKKARELFAR